MSSITDTLISMSFYTAVAFVVGITLSFIVLWYTHHSVKVVISEIEGLSDKNDSSYESILRQVTSVKKFHKNILMGVISLILLTTSILCVHGGLNTVLMIAIPFGVAVLYNLFISSVFDKFKDFA